MRVSREGVIRHMTHHTGTAHWRANTLEPTEMKLGCLDSSSSTAYVQKHASQFEMGFCLYEIALRQKVETGRRGHAEKVVSSFSYLLSSPRGGQVRQTAAGYRPKSLPPTLPFLFLFSSSLAEPRKWQARRHGGDRA